MTKLTRVLIPALAYGGTNYYDVTVSTVDAHPSIREVFLFTVD